MWKWSCGSVWFPHFSIGERQRIIGVHDDWQKIVLWHQIFLFPMRFLHGIKIPKVIMPRPRLSCWGLLSRRLGGSLFRKQRGCPSKLSRLSIRRFRIAFQPFIVWKTPNNPTPSGPVGQVILSFAASLVQQKEECLCRFLKGALRLCEQFLRFVHGFLNALVSAQRGSPLLQCSGIHSQIVLVDRLNLG